MVSTLETVRLVVQLFISISAVLWFPYGVVYRIYHSRKMGVGYWEIETPTWHQVIFWPILLGLVAIGIWGILT